MNQKGLRIIVGCGSFVLIGTALFHASGYKALVGAVDEAGLRGFFGAGIKGLWLMFSFQLVVVAFLCLSVAWRPSHQTKLVLLFCAALLTIDIGLLLWFVGLFVGEALLAITVGCYILSAALVRPVNSPKNFSISRQTSSPADRPRQSA